MRELGNDTRRIRQQLRMTQEEFARTIAVATSTVARWENDRSGPSRLSRRAIEILVHSRGIGPAGATDAPALGTC